MTDDRPSINDPYLSPLLAEVDEWAFTPVAKEKLRSLVLRAFQQGRAKVIRDIAEDEKRPKKAEITGQFGSIRNQLNRLEQDYLQRLSDPPESLSAEQMNAVLTKVQDALLKQMKNR